MKTSITAILMALTTCLSAQTEPQRTTTPLGTVIAEMVTQTTVLEEPRMTYVFVDDEGKEVNAQDITDGMRLTAVAKEITEDVQQVILFFYYNDKGEKKYLPLR